MAGRPRRPRRSVLPSLDGADTAVKDTLDFIVIGAMKSGTTSLFEHLRRHPELHLPPSKEDPFFSHPAMYARGWQTYMDRSFFGADPALKWGTVTGQYMVGGLWDEPSPGTDGDAYGERTVPARIRERVPDARLIAILRDPVERARSYHRMALLNRWDDRPFEQAIDELLRPEALEESRRRPRQTTGYVTWGEYGRILAGYLAVFPREQILVTFTDELEQDPMRLLRRIYEFIGVRSDFVADSIGVRYRAGATKQRIRLLGFQSPLNVWRIQRALAGNAVAKQLWHAIPERGRRQIDRVVARAGYEIDLWNRRAEDGPVDFDRVTLERLRAHYAPDTDRLAALLGSHPPWQR